MSLSTVRVLLALLFATSSVLFFRYVASPSTPSPPSSSPSSTLPSLPSPLTSSPFSSANSPSSASPSVRSPPPIASSIVDCIGNTPLIELRSLSALLNRRILAKVEFLNPGGSIKDRTGLFLLQSIDAQRRLQEGEEEVERRTTDPSPPDGGEGLHGTVVEATGGNTGVVLALLAPLFGYSCLFTHPASISQEKVSTMRALGATTVPCPAVPFTSPQHFYHTAAHLAQVTPNAYPTLQFESLVNAAAHYRTTGPEIWQQTGGAVQAFVCAAGTGGTIAGVSRYLKERDARVKCYLIDPPSSGLLSWYTRGGWEGREGDIASVVEGIGLYRLTANQAGALVDGALAGSEREAVEMAWWLLKQEGVWVGASAALNVCGAVKVARLMGEGDTVVTVLCDGGAPYRDKLYNPAWLEAQGMAHVTRKRSAGEMTLNWIK